MIYYGTYRAQKLYFRLDSDISMNIENSYYSPDDVFSSELNGMHFAFGISSYDGYSEPIEDLDYGHLSASYLQWGLDADKENNI